MECSFHVDLPNQWSIIKLTSFHPNFWLITNIIFWILLSYLLISLFENLVHRFFMHKKSFLKSVYRIAPYLLEVFESHAVRHHSIWYREFDYEPDPLGRQENLKVLFIDVLAMLLLTSVIWVFLLWFNLLSGIIFISVFFIHRFLWNTIHTQMHIPEDVIFRNWKIYRFLARHHFLHHQDTRINFNVVAPLADSLLGTVGKPRLKDIREMLRLGYLLPRSERIQKQFQRQGIPILGANH